MSNNNSNTKPDAKSNAKIKTFDDIIDAEIKDMEDRTFVGAFFRASASTVKTVATTVVMGTVLVNAGVKKSMKEHIPQLASDVSKAADNGVLAVHNAVRSLDELNDYDRSLSLAENIRVSDEKAKLEQENKLLKKNLKRVAEGKDPIFKKDLSYYQNENARLKKELEEALAKRNTNQS